ncbi:hypothetical protein EMM73_12795 [Rheinheimera sediminis]|uniref:HEPN domain-containing protein n=1 Tax=Rheinheimera sp. YQF-1 TaxID=2499626 RepID=UPI000FDCB99D|nr:HEPN domain-containing protein [Rheinheimera sp. YQF-1]RVT45579.1 hypothetical protein EMM73_12795 [Rheinheimera sp. YQF-1]
MKNEYLILVPGTDSFCSSKKAFVDFLKVDALITISGQKLAYRRSPKAKDLVSARFRVETDKVKDKDERFFLLVLESMSRDAVDEFSELCERVKSISERISPGSTAINTLWDGVGRIYAEKSYPVINEVENLMRRLIAKFMLINVGMNWSKDAINPELFKKIESYDEEEVYLNDLYKLDFIHLKQVLFDKKRDISLEELDRILLKTTFSDDDKEKILKYVPKSNWEKYFSSLLDEKDKGLEKKWEILYKLRNKVAHNRNLTKVEFDQIVGLSSDIKAIIRKATEKLVEIDLDEEDRELIIYSYQSESPQAIGFIAEKAVAEYYARSGYEISQSSTRRGFDFIAEKDGETLAIDVKSIRPRSFYSMLRMVAERQFKHWMSMQAIENFSKIRLVCVLREDDVDYPLTRVRRHAQEFSEAFGEQVEIHFGKINDECVYAPMEV